MAIITQRLRKTQKQAQMEAVIDAAVEKHLAEKGLSPAVAAASQPVGGATYIPATPGQSSPFNQTGGSQAGYTALPRPDGDFNSLFGPGVPLVPDPLDPLGPSGRAMPRRNAYMVAQNLNLVDRAVPWSMLTNLAENCDVVQRCIQLVQDGMVGRHWGWGFSDAIVEQIMQDTGVTNHARAMDIAKEKYGPELAAVKTFFERPDTRSGYSFSVWLTEMVWQHLVYDAVVIYPQYNLGGKLMSLNGIDGSTIKILKDNQGFPPEPPAPAYQQILYGFPRGEFQQAEGPVDDEFQRDQLLYYMRRPRPNTVYGYPQVEECLTIATTYMARQAWMAAEYTYGAMPKTYMKTAETESWTPEQLAFYEQILNDRLSGQIARRQQAFMLRPGMEPVFAPQIEEHYKSDYDNFLLTQIGSKFGVPASQLGVQAKAGLSGGRMMEGEEDQTEHFVYTALINFFIDILNDIARRHLGVGDEITATCTDPGGSEEDILQQAEADSKTIGFGGLTLNDWRSKNGLPLYQMPEADEPAVITATGVTFLKGLLATQEATQQATLNPPQPSENGGADGNGNGNTGSGLQPGDSAAGPGEGTPASTTGDGGGSGSDASGSVGTAADDTTGGASNSDSQPAATAASKSTKDEFAAFLRFAKSRIGRSWRDFQFSGDVVAERAVRLNALGRAGDIETIRKSISGGANIGPRAGMISLDIPDGVLEPLPGGVPDLHITVAFMGMYVDDKTFAKACDAARKVAKDADGPLQGIVSGIAAFQPSVNSDGRVPVYAVPDVPGLEELHDELVAFDASSHASYKPHVTLAYIEPGDKWPDPVPPTKVVFKQLSVHRGDDVVHFTLGGDDDAAAKSADDGEQPHAAGLVVKAKDTGRVLMVQRSIKNHNEAAAGLWEWPGGRLDDGDDALDAAMREWQEEVGIPLPKGKVVGSWTTPDDRYQAFVYIIKHESDIELNNARGLDGTGDKEVENVAWWEPRDIVGNPACRVEVQSADWSLLGHAKSLAGDDDPKAELASKAGSAWANHPIRKYHDAIAAHYAPKLAKALRDGIRGIDDAVVTAKMGMKKAAGEEDKGTAADAVANNVSLSPSQAIDILKAIYGDAWLAASHVASEQVGSGAVLAQGLENALQSINWDTWEPGNQAAADLVSGGGLQELLDSAGVTITSVEQSMMERLTDTLANGIAAGDPVQVIGQAMRDLVADANRAFMIANTETARAVSTSSMNMYQASGVHEYDWIAEDTACPVCAKDAGDSPFLVGSGPSQPAHPNCRCAYAPHTGYETTPSALPVK